MTRYSTRNGVGRMRSTHEYIEPREAIEILRRKDDYSNGSGVITDKLTHAINDKYHNGRAVRTTDEIRQFLRHCREQELTIADFFN